MQDIIQESKKINSEMWIKILKNNQTNEFSSLKNSDEQTTFWNHVKNYEKAPYTTFLERLSKAGLDLPDPQEITEEEAELILYELIQKLGKMRVYLIHTDHLSDFELYTLLWSKRLRTKDQGRFDVSKSMGMSRYDRWRRRRFSNFTEILC